VSLVAGRAGRRGLVRAGPAPLARSGPDTLLTQAAISLGSTDWQEAVSDEQHGAAG
jgi:hypothetical protein